VRRVGLLAAGVALLGAVAVLTVLLLAPRGTPTAEERVEALAGEMRCPDCQALSVAESHTNAAAAIHAEIEDQVAAGRTDDEIRAYFVASYGEWILLAPPEPVVWWVPGLGLLLGIGALVVWFTVRGGLARQPAEAPPVPDEERRRIHDELEALDG
jgi:cytochrome c-type biogenesis protein CcmH